MKKTILIGVALVAMTFTTTSAQIVWDVRVGANASQFSEGGNGLKLGLKAGAGVEFAFSELFALKPGVNFSMKGSSVDGKFGIGEKESFNLSYLEVPVLASFRFPVTRGFSLALSVGPYGAYRLNNPDWADGLERFDAGVDGSLDFVFNRRFVIGAGAQYGLLDVSKDHSLKNINYSLTFGLKF